LHALPPRAFASASVVVTQFFVHRFAAEQDAQW